MFNKRKQRVIYPSGEVDINILLANININLNRIAKALEESNNMIKDISGVK